MRAPLSTQVLSVGTGGADAATLSAAPGRATTVRLLHTGATPVFFNFLDADDTPATVSVTTGVPLIPNIEYFFTKMADMTKVVAIIASGTASLYITECI